MHTKTIAKRLTIAFSLSFMLAACNTYKQFNTKQAFKQKVIKSKELSSALCGISLYDLDQNREVYNYLGNKYFMPASTQKIITTYVGLKYLGDRIPSFNYWLQDGGTIFIQPLADPTFLNDKFTSQEGIALLKNFKRIRLYCPDDAVQKMGSGWAHEDYLLSFSAQQSLMPLYGNLATISATNGNISIQPNAFKKAMIVQAPRAENFSATKIWDSNIFTVLPGSVSTQRIPFTPDASTIAKLLADTLRVPVELAGTLPSDKPPMVFYSQATNDMLRAMMLDSDNFIAEQTMLMVGLKQWKTSQISSVIDSLTKSDFSSLPQVPKMVDGSGLSRYNMCSPNSMIQVLNQLYHDFGWNRIGKIFAAGNQGKQLTGYFDGDYANHIYAKTGGMSNNTALCGYLVTKKGHRLSFAIFANHFPGKVADSRRQFEKFLKNVIDTY